MAGGLTGRLTVPLERLLLGPYVERSVAGCFTILTEERVVANPMTARTPEPIRDKWAGGDWVLEEQVHYLGGAAPSGGQCPTVSLAQVREAFRTVNGIGGLNLDAPQKEAKPLLNFATFSDCV